MARSPRADAVGGLYHALNRGNLRADIFKKDADFTEFEKILHEGLELYEVELFSYQLIIQYDNSRISDRLTASVKMRSNDS